MTVDRVLCHHEFGRFSSAQEAGSLKKMLRVQPEHTLGSIDVVVSYPGVVVCRGNSRLVVVDQFGRTVLSRSPAGVVLQ